MIFATGSPQSEQSIEISVVVPLFNEQDAVLPFIHLLISTLCSCSKRWEIILVDDGSTDGTYQSIQNLSTKDPAHIRGLLLSRNFGKEAALLAGMAEAHGACVAVMDGDGQHPPWLIPAMLRLWRLGKAQIVSAVKVWDSSRRPSWARRCFYRTMRRLTHIDVTNDSDFKLLDRKAVDAILSLPEKRRFFRGLSAWIGFEQRSVCYKVRDRIAGDTKWCWASLLTLSLTAITSFTSAPLTWVFYAGSTGVFVAGLLTIQAFYSWIIGAAVSGWTSLTIVVLFFASVQLIALGVIGLYLGRIYEESKQRQPYFVADRTAQPSSTIHRGYPNIVEEPVRLA